MLLASLPALATTSVYTGTFLQGAASVSVPFQPKAMIVRGSINTAVGQANNMNYVVGYCLPGGTQVSVWSVWDNGGATSSAKRGLISDSCAILWNSAGTLLADLSLGSCTSSSCTLTWRTNDAVARIYDFTAFGGATVSAAVGIGGNGTLTPTITTSFPPQMLFFAASTTASITHTGTPSANVDFSIGAQPGSSAAASSISYAGANNTTASGFVQCTTNSICWLASGGSSVFISGNVSSTNSTSYTMSLTGNTFSSSLEYLALGDSGTTNWTEGNSTAPTSTGTQNLTVTGTPGWAMLWSMGVTTANGTATVGSATFGHGVVTTGGNLSRFLSMKNAANPQVAISEYKTDHVLRLLDVTGGSVNASVDLATFTSTNLALHWDVVSATAYNFSYLTCDCTYVPLANSYRVPHKATQ